MNPDDSTIIFYIYIISKERINVEIYSIYIRSHPGCFLRDIVFFLTAGSGFFFILPRITCVRVRPFGQGLVILVPRYLDGYINII